MKIKNKDYGFLLNQIIVLCQMRFDRYDEEYIREGFEIFISTTTYLGGSKDKRTYLIGLICEIIQKEIFKDKSDFYHLDVLFNEIKEEK